VLVSRDTIQDERIKPGESGIPPDVLIKLETGRWYSKTSEVVKLFCVPLWYQFRDKALFGFPAIAHNNVNLSQNQNRVSGTLGINHSFRFPRPSSQSYSGKSTRDGRANTNLSLENLPGLQAISGF
jgi:hypothetical protein